VIIGCPACQRTYRLDEAQFRPEARLRCTRCGHLFTQGAAPGAHPPPKPAATPPAARTAGSGAQVVLADAGRPFRQRVRPILESLGCRVATVDDGTEAFKAAVSHKPALMVVSVHLAGLSGVAICEGVKGSPHLKSIRLALVGSELSADLFNRDTALAYGADLFLDERMDEGDLRDGLAALLSAAGAAPAESSDATPIEEDDPITTLVAGGDGPANPAEEIARLARIMLADLRLYNPDRFGEALRSGRLLDAFKDELARGRDLVDHRFPQVTSRQDLLAAALREGARKELHDPS